MIFNVFEVVRLEHPDYVGSKAVQAKLDTGAFSSSIDESFANDMHLPDFEDGKKIFIRTIAGRQERRRVRGRVVIQGVGIDIIFNVADRAQMKFPIIIGRRDLVGHSVLVSPQDGDPENIMNITKVNNE